MNHYTNAEIDDEITTNNNALLEFYSIIDELKKTHPNYTPQQFKKFIESNDELKSELDDLVAEFKQCFSVIDTTNKVMLDILISLSTIGINIEKNISDDDIKDAI